MNINESSNLAQGQSKHSLHHRGFFFHLSYPAHFHLYVIFFTIAILTFCFVLFCQLSKGQGNPKSAIWIDCGIHAREWISPAFCLWFIGHVSRYHTWLPFSKQSKRSCCHLSSLPNCILSSVVLIHLLPQCQLRIFPKMYMEQ